MKLIQHSIKGNEAQHPAITDALVYLGHQNTQKRKTKNRNKSMQANQHYVTTQAEPQNLTLPTINSASSINNDQQTQERYQSAQHNSTTLGKGSLKGPKFVKQGSGMYYLQQSCTNALVKNKGMKQAEKATAKAKGINRRSKGYLSPKD